LAEPRFRAKNGPQPIDVHRFPPGEEPVSLFLHGLGHFNPEHEITNTFLEELDIGTSDAWIQERVGIRARRTVMPLDYIRQTRNVDPRVGFEAATYSNAEMAERAARMAVQRAGIAMSDIGMVITGSSAPDTLSPADACNLAERLGLEVTAFDINSACTSFFVPIHLLSMMQPDRLPPFILLAVPESLTRTVDYRDRTTAVLWGDGAAAAVVSLREPGRAEILETSLSSSPEGHNKVVVPRHGFFRQDGQAVQKFAVKRTAETLRRVREAADPRRAFGFVGHQANMRMLESVCKLCHISSERHFSNVEQFGNTAAAGSPSVISMNWDRWTMDDELGVVGVGAGLTWGGYLLRFMR
jgi:3-oxoacyl-[acyl-carrier-protein] synthase III